MSDQETKTYIVLPGQHHGKAREFGPGSKLELTDEEAAPLIGFRVALYVPEGETAAPEPEPKKPAKTSKAAKEEAETADPDTAAKEEAAALIKEAEAKKGK